MSSVKLNPAVDLGLGPDYNPQADGIESIAGISATVSPAATPQSPVQYPRELDINPPAASTVKAGASLNGILDINAAKPAPPQTPVQPAVEPKGMIESIAAEKAAVQPAAPLSVSSATPDDKASQVIMIAAVVMFVISLAAAGYFLFKYFA